MSLKTNPATKFRTDIQVLRGFAVLIVLFYHAKMGFLPAGYLGVDVFFVISGFLITHLVKSGLERGDFSFSEFYFRRAKRLLPAAYVTFFVTALLAPFFLGSIEMSDFRMQMLGAVAFIGNIVLWQQSGYFGGAAEFKPLLHVWSLAIEEQYYFILPAFLFFLPRRFWKPVTAFVLVFSLALCLFLVQKKASATFFLLPTRGWELAIGSLGALFTISGRWENVLKLIFWPALAALLLLPAMKIAGYHPGPDAFLICSATLIIILRNHPLLSTGRIMGGLARIGDISYSLYLVHWPLFAFVNNVWFGEGRAEVPIGWRAGLLVLSLLLAYLLNRYVEVPMRYVDIKKTKRVLVRTMATSIALVLTTVGFAQTSVTDKDYRYIRRINHGMGPACAFESTFKPIQECRNSDSPEILVWGDSYAMHLISGIMGAENGAARIVQATRSACGPLVDIAQVEITYRNGYNKAWAESCVSFNDSVLQYLEKADSVKTVVLSSTFEQFIDGRAFQLLKRGSNGEDFLTVEVGIDPAIEGIKATVDRVRALGKKIVVVAPPPNGGFDIGLCIERLETGLPILGGPKECKVSQTVYEKTSGPVHKLLRALPEGAGVDVVDFDSYLCHSGSCETYIDGVLIYRDLGHLSYEGSIFLAKKSGLVERIHKLAR